MENKRFLNAKDVAEYMEISESMAYRIIRQLNDELKKSSYGRIIMKIEISRKTKKTVIRTPRQEPADFLLSGISSFSMSDPQ